MYLVKFIGTERDIESFIVEDLEIKEGMVYCRGFLPKDQENPYNIEPLSSQCSVPLCKIVVITSLPVNKTDTIA
jgi:hypothetical protein